MAPGVVAPGGVVLANVPALMPLRRLTRVEYENTVRDLLGPTTRVTVALPDDPLGPSTYGTPTGIGGVEQDLFEQAAGQAIDSAGAALVPTCKGDERACATDFIKTLGKRAFRRPVADDEVTLLVELYDGLRKTPISFDHATAIKGVLSGMLQSPRFLYHWQLGGAKPIRGTGGLLKLSSWELASRLSYLFWGTMPDAALFTAAEGGKLDTPEGVEVEARRLLGDKKRAGHFATSLFGQWVSLNKLDGLVKEKKFIPDLSAAVKNGIRGETEQLLAKAVLEGGTLSALLT